MSVRRTIRPSHFWFPDNNLSTTQPNLFKLSHIAVYHQIQVNFDYGVFHIYRSWVMALFLLENKDFLGFRMIFKVPLNQIFSNFNTMLYTIKYRLSTIRVYFSFTVHKLLSITRICKILMAMKWISCKINHNMFHSFHCLIQNLECGGICDHHINFL
jgi:hypothetical protein